MYDFGHPRTVKQYETAWSELQSALGSDNEAGVLLSVSGDQLLLDGMALESAAAEKSFARMLSGAGIASIHFSPKVTQASLARFVRGFPTGTGAKPAQLVEQLKAALQGDPHIHVNEVCFVPADSSIAKSSVAAHITARTLGMDSAAASELFNDPEKLLQLIVAAEGTKGSGRGTGSGGPGGGGTGGGSGDGSGSGGWATAVAARAVADTAKDTVLDSAPARVVQARPDMEQDTETAAAVAEQWLQVPSLLRVLALAAMLVRGTLSEEAAAAVDLNSIPMQPGSG